MKGHHFQTDSTVSSHVSDHLPNSSHGLFANMCVLGSFAGSSRFGGGLNGGSCDFTRLRLTAAMEAANLSTLSCGALIVGLSAAFSSFTRHLVFLVPDSMDNLCGRLCESGYPNAEASEIVEGLSAYSYWTQSGGSDHLLALIGKLHIGSWFCLRPLTTIFESCRGALAGSSLGEYCSFLGLHA